jgi:hypothetical protein
MVNINSEPFSLDLFNEIMPLAQKCWDESTDIKGKSCAFYGQRGFVVMPDYEKYESLSSGMKIITLRDDGRLVGYVVGFLYSSMHYKGILCGFGDSMFVEPEYRSHCIQMVERFESEVASGGAKIIGWPVTKHSYVYNALKAQSFVADDVIMEKLCVSH